MHNISFGTSAVAIMFFILALGFSCNNKTSSHLGEHEYTNELINETSPYLLQHAHNPVNWYPWGEKALKKAREEDKLLLISVGYSACHWCHVMEHESFEDTLVARLMNENFVNIKVDREERPDIDDVYMTACQLSSQRGCGWPLNAIALPGGQPVWAATYFPKSKWIEILEYFIKVKKEEPRELETYAEQLTGGIKAQDELPNFTGEPDFAASDLNGFADKISGTVDFRRGGRNGAPKFPLPNQFEFLLQQYFYTGNNQYLEAVNITLENMALGGIYDQLGGGFARYSTDEKWLVPHFEKMLYDNGQLVGLYAHAFQVTKNPLFKKVVYQTIDFVKRELMMENGGFYSSLDADSEGEEGLFYIWKKSEIDSLLTPSEAKLINEYYNVTNNGNWEKGHNILHQEITFSKFAEKKKINPENLQKELDQATEKLFAYRAKRIRPGLDDKVLAAWNGLMLNGLLQSYKAFGDPDILQLALNNADFLEKNMIKNDGRIDRNYKAGKSSINGFLDDYAFIIDAFIELYQVTFDKSWLDKADKLTQYAIDHFFDSNSGMFFYTSKIDPPLIARKKVITDNVIPASNSAMATVLFHLGTLTYNEVYIGHGKVNVSQCI